MPYDDPGRVRRYRVQLGRIRSAIRELNSRGYGYWCNKHLVTREWLLYALEVRILELEHKIVEAIGIQNTTVKRRNALQIKVRK